MACNSRSQGTLVAVIFLDSHKIRGSHCRLQLFLLPCTILVGTWAGLGTLTVGERWRIWSSWGTKGGKGKGEKIGKRKKKRSMAPVPASSLGVVRQSGGVGQHQQAPWHASCGLLSGVVCSSCQLFVSRCTWDSSSAGHVGEGKCVYSLAPNIVHPVGLLLQGPVSGTRMFSADEVWERGSLDSKWKPAAG